jgi:hypothetical protein
VHRYLKSSASTHDWATAAKIAQQIAKGEDPVKRIAQSLAKARTFGELETLERLGMPVDHLFDEVEEGSA